MKPRISWMRNLLLLSLMVLSHCTAMTKGPATATAPVRVDSQSRSMVSPTQPPYNPAQQPPLSAEVQAELMALIKRVAIENDLPGVSMCVTSGVNSWTGVYGVADRVSKRPLTAADRMRIGSTSKTFTAQVVLQLAQEQKLSLDDPVELWLPEVLPDYKTDEITVRMLLYHTSGIVNYVFQPIFRSPFLLYPESHWPMERLISVAENAPRKPPLEPGEKWDYSNTNTVLLGMIAEAATGKTWQDLVDERIIQRFGLTETVMPRPNENDIPPPFAHGYINWNNYADDSLGVTLPSYLVNRTILNPSLPSAAGAVISTSRDLCRWVTAIATGESLDPLYHRIMMTWVVAAEGIGAGLGLFYEPTYGMVGHRGQITGYDTSMQFIAEKNTAFAIIINRTLEWHDNADTILGYEAIEILFPDLKPRTLNARPYKQTQFPETPPLTPSLAQ